MNPTPMTALTPPRGAVAEPESRWPDGDPDEPWRMLLSPRGRISRRRFWMWGVGALLGLGLVLHGLLAVAGVRSGTAEHLVNVALAWPAVMISIKRWHDTGRPGTWVLVALVPVVGWLGLLLANGALRGTPGPNRFGPTPGQ